jgi:membrane protein DedA with SNARE-associated domain
VQEIVNFIVESVGSLGYLGIFFMMFLESSFFPFPSEVVMVPAGYLASKGEMNIYFVVFFGIFGSLAGAIFNYYLAVRFGRRFFIRYGKYLLLKEDTLDKMEKFFIDHGHISTFTGRLIPAVRQYISLPAGLARMDIWKFSLYTSLGAGIWVIILTLLGYFIGENQALLKEYLHSIIITILCIISIGIIWYIKKYKSKEVIV